VTAYAAALGGLPPGADALDTLAERLRPAHLRLEIHPAGAYGLEGGWRSGLGGGICAGISGRSGEDAPSARRAALTGGAVPELTGGSALRAVALRRAASAGSACRELAGGDRLRGEAARGALLAGGACLELRGTDRHWDRFARRGTFLRGCMYAETAG